MKINMNELGHLINEQIPTDKQTTEKSSTLIEQNMKDSKSLTMSASERLKHLINYGVDPIKDMDAVDNHDTTDSPSVEIDNHSANTLTSIYTDSIADSSTSIDDSSSSIEPVTETIDPYKSSIIDTLSKFAIQNNVLQYCDPSIFNTIYDELEKLDGRVDMLKSVNVFAKIMDKVTSRF